MTRKRSWNQTKDIASDQTMELESTLSTHMPVRPETTHLSSGPTFRIAPPLFYMVLLAAVHGSARRF